MSGEKEKGLDVPIVDDFWAGVQRETDYQRSRWGSDSDAGKAPHDWFWLIGYLAGKALAAVIAGNREKALHHTVSTAAACANWHAAISGSHTAMRPGHAEPVEDLADVAPSAPIVHKTVVVNSEDVERALRMLRTCRHLLRRLLRRRAFRGER